MTQHRHLVIAGVQKAGTTAWFEYLSQHDHVWPSRVRETHALKAADVTADGYAQWFRGAPADCWRLESTPSYVAAGAPVVERLERVAPSARVVISLRDPVDRLVSHYLMKVRTRGWERPPPFERFVDDLLHGTGDTRTINIFRNGEYAALLRPWFERLGDRVRVVFLEDLRADPAAAVAGLLGWIGLDPGQVGRFDLSPRNAGTRTRSTALFRAAQAASRRMAGLYQRHPRLRGTMRRAHDRINGAADQQRPLVPPEARAALAERYRTANHDLADMLRARGHADVPAWVDGRALPSDAEAARG